MVNLMTETEIEVEAEILSEIEELEPRLTIGLVEEIGIWKFT